MKKKYILQVIFTLFVICLFMSILFEIETLNRLLEEKERKIDSIDKEYTKKFDKLKKNIKVYEKLILHLNNTVNKYNKTISVKENTISELKTMVGELEKEKEHLLQEKEKTRKSFKLVNPTYKDLMNFVERDKTNYHGWSEEYDCTEFSNTFIKNFAEEGYFSCVTEINLKGGGEEFGHVIVAVETEDRGLVYIEPQTDTKIFGDNLKVGRNYCSLVDWDCNWEITKVSSCFSYQYR